MKTINLSFSVTDPTTGEEIYVLEPHEWGSNYKHDIDGSWYPSICDIGDLMLDIGASIDLETGFVLGGQTGEAKNLNTSMTKPGMAIYDETRSIVGYTPSDRFTVTPFVTIDGKKLALSEILNDWLGLQEETSSAIKEFKLLMKG